MKKIFLLIFTAILSVGTMITVLANNDIKVLLNDEYIQFDAEPFIEDGRTLVPIRAITEAMGCEVEWNTGTQTADISNSESNVSVKIGSTTITKTDNSTYEKQNITIDVPAKIYMDRTYVPLRAISEAFGADVDWDGSKNLVTITYDLSSSGEIISFNDEAFEYSVRRALALSLNYDWGTTYDGEITSKLLDNIEELVLYNSPNETPLESIADIDKLPNLNELIFGDDIENIKDLSIISDPNAGFEDFGFELCVRMNINNYYEGSSKGYIYVGKITDEMCSKVTTINASDLPDFIKISSLEDLKIVPNVKRLSISSETSNIVDYSPIESIKEWTALFLDGIEVNDDNFLYNIDVTEAVVFPNIDMWLLMGNAMNYEKALKAYENVYEQIIILDSKIQKTVSNYEKFKILHDYLVNNMKYDYDYVQNAYDNEIVDPIYLSFVAGKGICSVYAETYMWLCRRYGLECWMVDGDAKGAIYEGDTPSWGLGHAWNIVKLDGKYYHVDVTFDDPIGANDLEYDYFLVSDSMMMDDHRWGGEEYGEYMFDFTSDYDLETIIPVCPDDYR